MKKIKIKNTLTDISSAVLQAEEILKATNVKTEHRVRAILTLEETLVRIQELVADAEMPIQIVISKGLRKTRILVSYKGDALKLSDLCPQSPEVAELSEEYGPEAESMIRDMVLRANAERINCRHSRGVNTVTILVSKSEKALLYDTLTALCVGLIAGLVIRNVATTETAAWVSSNIFMPLYSIFITMISMIITPFIFFSLASSISGFQDMGSLGRTGGKVFGCYMLTTMLGILMCIGMFYVMQPGLGAVVSSIVPSGVVADDVTLSPMERLMGIIPTSFVGSFAENDMLQIMFLAILIGVAIGRTTKYSEKLREGCNALNELFSRITSILSELLPVAIFGSTANMAATLEVESISVLTSWVGYTLVCIGLQFCLYAVLMVVVGRLNPLPFIRKFSPAMVTAFMTSSSSVTIPTSQECCRKLGVSSRIYSFSIPLGANINMDGTSLLFCGTALFLTNLYGITLTPSTLVSVAFTIMLISVAMPGVPGAGTACLLMVFAIVGVPADAFGLVIGLFPLLELLETSLNVTGDGAMTTIVANSEKMLDKQAYYND